MPNEYTPVRWSRGGQVSFVDGYGWGIAPCLTPIRLGREEEVERWLSGDEEPPGRLCKVIYLQEGDAIAKEAQRTRGGKK